MASKIIVIGSGIAALSAAEAARKEDESADIDLYTEEDVLPYYRLRVAEVLAKPEQATALFLHDAAWYEEKKINVHLGECLERLDAEAKLLYFASGKTSTYDRLILATGSRSRKPDVPGSHRPGVFTLWTMTDAKNFSRAIIDQGIKTCAIIGGGVLGLEAAWQLHQCGVHVSILSAEHIFCADRLTTKPRISSTITLSHSA